jgi:hypothetical protein
MNEWLYWDKVNPEDYLGFVYIITNLQTGKFYVGKKVFWNNKKHKLTKKQLAEITGPGRKSTHEIIRTESDWKNYWGSNKELLADVKSLGKANFERRILKPCKTKKELTYYEMHHQCVKECITNSTTHSYNDNILGKFFRKDFVTQP